MTYNQFKQKNDENKARFTEAKKRGLFNLGAINPYTSFRVEQTNFSNGDGQMEICSNIKGCYTACDIRSFLQNMVADPYIHCSNPSKLKGYHGF